MTESELPGEGDEPDENPEFDAFDDAMKRLLAARPDDPGARQRARDRAGDDPPPSAGGRSKK